MSYDARRGAIAQRLASFVDSETAEAAIFGVYLDHRTTSTLETAFLVLAMATSVDSLPEELLVGILVAIIEHDTTEYAHQRTSLALVSRRWNAVVKHTPSLWSRLSGEHSLPLNKLSLSRSRSLPLELDFVFKKAQAQELQAIVTSFQEACRHIHRWRTANLKFGVELTSGLPKLLSRSAPLLERVSLETEPWTISEPLENLFGENADRLTSIRLVGVEVPWDTKVLSGLVVLELEMIHNDPPTITIENILSILVSSPGLSTLKLKSIEFNENWAVPSQHPVIDLSHLTSLYLSIYDSTITSRLLRILHAPSCRHMSLEGFLDEVDDVPSFITLIPPFIPRMSAGVGSSKIVIGIDYIEFSLRLPPGTPYALSIKLDEINSATTLDSFFSILPPEFLALETWLTYRDRHPPDEVRAILATANRANVTKLTMETVGFHTTTGVLERLGQPAPSWLFPAMQHLVVDMGEVPARALPQMVQARYGTANSPLHLTKLLTTECKIRHDSDRAALESVVGTDVLEWNGTRDPDESDLEDSDESDLAENSDEGSKLAESELEGSDWSS